MVLDGTLAALFIAGLASGLHCAGMCGGIVMMMSGVGRHRGAARAPGAARSHAAAAPGLATFALADIGRAGSSVQTLRRPSAAAALLEGQPAMLLFNAGRIGSYALAGALAGGIGSHRRGRAPQLPGRPRARAGP
ncbi:MAG TPA: sulfite exporter TauE/SafE family protein, partial [Burkholderiaceae bacterium]|nr:sulfite exporter TauE/SafE family protein [Burkholderiaceae bacterium]